MMPDICNNCVFGSTDCAKKQKIAASGASTCSLKVPLRIVRTAESTVAEVSYPIAIGRRVETHLPGGKVLTTDLEG